jgi:hypothetical protein
MRTKVNFGKNGRPAVRRRVFTRPKSLVVFASVLGLLGLTSFLVVSGATASKPRPLGTSAKAMACERTHRICNKAAWRALPLRTQDASGASLMTESQAIAAVGWQSGDQVGAQEMTYGQAQAAYPSLASESFIDQTREVWVITLYYPTAVANPGSAPEGATLPPISSATIVLDAATGTETDWCAGCSTIPASTSAAHAAKSASRQ